MMMRDLLQAPCSRSLPLLGLIASALLVGLGCDDGRPARVPISGTVTIEGQPLKFGSVSFVPAAGRPAGGALDSNGRYELTCYEKGDGTMAGEYKVAVTGVESLGEHAQRWHAPQKYRDAQASGLTATVEGPRDDLNFEITWDGAKPFVEKF